MHAQCVLDVAGTSSGLVVEEAGYIVYGGWDGVGCATQCLRTSAVHSWAAIPQLSSSESLSSDWLQFRWLREREGDGPVQPWRRTFCPTVLVVALDMSRLIVSGILAPLLRSWAYIYSYIPRQKSRDEIIQVCASQFDTECSLIFPVGESTLKLSAWLIIDRAWRCTVGTPVYQDLFWRRRCFKVSPPE